jgi:putative oxygen-independent coproporphyrinogen III oxidase
MLAMADAIHKELILRKKYLNGSSIHTIYFGGGTPSLLDQDSLRLIIDTIRKHYPVKADAEITLEANPDDLTFEKLAILKDAGINRLSIGLQSFDDHDLKFMNRVHNSSQGIESVVNAKKSGFDNISIDLIYGSPVLTDEQWNENLGIAFSLDVEHLSCYALTVEQKTPLASMIRHKKVPDVDDEKCERHFNMLIERAGEEGFEHYEISNFARDKKYSRHNTSYWQRKKYLGVGPSAHSFDGESRQWNVYNNQVYIRSLEDDRIPFEREELTRKDKFNEYILTTLRTKWGLDLDHVGREFGEIHRHELEGKLESFCKKEMVSKNTERYFLTHKGKFFADKISVELFM